MQGTFLDLSVASSAPVKSGETAFYVYFHFIHHLKCVSATLPNNVNAIMRPERWRMYREESILEFSHSVHCANSVFTANIKAGRRRLPEKTLR